MRILVSNDDGVHSKGLSILVEALAKVATAICVVAPDRNRSGASNSLTLSRPLESYCHSNGFFSLDGTPTDCVHLGRSGLFLDGFLPDIVVSGINYGPNLGDDVLYSGTVAAAMEGRYCQYNPIAVSMGSHHPEYFETAAQFVSDLIPRMSSLNLAKGTVLNVNVPDIPLAEVMGVHVTRLGHRFAADVPIEVLDPRGNKRYWVAGSGDASDKTPGTDFFALEHNAISITPLQIDMTHYAGQDELADWLENIK